MTNPRTLLLSIAATACCFILALITVVAPAPTVGVGAIGAATTPGPVSAVALDTDRFDPAMSAVAKEPAASSLALALDAADRDNGPNARHGRARRP